MTPVNDAIASVEAKQPEARVVADQRDYRSITKRSFAHRWRVRTEPSVQNLSVAWVQMHLPAKQIEAAMQLATDVFEDASVAEEWLKEPNLATDNQPPIVLLGSEEGFARVKTFLERIDYGVLT